MKSSTRAVVLALSAVCVFSSISISDDTTELRDAVDFASANIQKTGWTVPNLHGRAPQDAVVQKAALRVAPLWKAALQACSLGHKVENSTILDVIRLRAPLRMYTTQDSRKYVLTIADNECPQPLENVVFIAGHGFGNGTGLFYATSPQGEMIEAVKGSYVPGSGFQYQRITQVTPEIQSDFRQMVSDLATTGSTSAQR